MKVFTAVCIAAIAAGGASPMAPQGGTPSVSAQKSSAAELPIFIRRLVRGVRQEIKAVREAVREVPLSANGRTESIEGEDRLAGPFELPSLPYDYKALEPAIDEATMRVHHDKHFQAYLTNLNEALGGNKEAGTTIADLQKGAIKAGPAVRNNGGGFYNHGMFFESMTPGQSGAPSAALSKAIERSFQTMDAMKAEFSEAAAERFGSGWAWLGVTPDDSKLATTSTPNQDNPLMEGVDAKAMIPILGLDVWEHAYYLKYQNRRKEYIEAWWSVVNWAKVSEYYEKYASQGKPVVWG